MKFHYIHVAFCALSFLNVRSSYPNYTLSDAPNIQFTVAVQT